MPPSSSFLRRLAAVAAAAAASAALVHALHPPQRTADHAGCPALQARTSCSSRLHKHRQLLRKAHHRAAAAGKQGPDLCPYGLLDFLVQQEGTVGKVLIVVDLRSWCSRGCMCGCSCHTQC